LFRQPVVAILAYDQLHAGSTHCASKVLAMRLFNLLGVWMSLVIAGAGVLDSLSGAEGRLGERNDALRSAVREGDLLVVQVLLDAGAEVNAKDEVGTTILMHAVLDADVAVVKLLLSKGADANAQNRKGATALLWALHDPDKVKLLLDHAAKIPEEAVFVAAAIPGGSRTLKLLADRGANLKVSKGGFTPLDAAARGGDPDTIRFLIDHGADIGARTKSRYTALYGAASWPDNAANVSLLLDHGADPKTRVEIFGLAADVFTPVMAAAMRGDAAALKPLLDRGADVNVQGGDFGRTALLMATTTGREDVVKLLLDKGANPHAKDRLGNTPLRWAKKRGNTSIVKLLEKAGGNVPPIPEGGEDLPRLHQTVTAASVRQAVVKSLPLLQKSGETFATKRSCISCHHQALVAMTVGLAHKRGFKVDKRIAEQERARLLTVLERNCEQILLGSGVTDELAPAYMLAALAAEEQKPNFTTDALVQFLVLRQREDGSWRTPVYRPPQDASDITFTALAARGLRLFAPKGRHKEMEGRFLSAREWLVRAKSHDTEDNTFRLLGLAWTNAEAQHIQQAAAVLLQEQRGDGGWAQLPTLKSDAYATGQVLLALREGGGLAVDHEAYRRGVEFLLKTQLADGSWFVPTRSFPLQPHVDTGFPHGRSQFISLAATSWATMALLLTAVSVEKMSERPNEGCCTGLTLCLWPRHSRGRLARHWTR
jgi:ankyrin repeat protein